MGQELYERYAVARDIFDRVDSVLLQEFGEKLSEICFYGSQTLIRECSAIQLPAIFTVSVAHYEVLKSLGFKPDVMAGFSTGNLAALVADGSFKLEEIAKILFQSGKDMDYLASKKTGKVRFVKGLSIHDATKICKDASWDGVVETGYHMTPKIIGLSGDIEPVDRALEIARSAPYNAEIITPDFLGPYHSRLAHDAGYAMDNKFWHVTWTRNETKTPLFTGVLNHFGSGLSTIPETNLSMIFEEIRLVLADPIYWAETIVNMLRFGVTEFVLIEPAAYLSRFIKDSLIANPLKDIVTSSVQRTDLTKNEHRHKAPTESSDSGQLELF